MKTLLSYYRTIQFPTQVGMYVLVCSWLCIGILIPITALGVQEKIYEYPEIYGAFPNLYHLYRFVPGTLFFFLFVSIVLTTLALRQANENYESLAITFTIYNLIWLVAGFGMFDLLAQVLFPFQLEFATIFRYLGWIIFWLAGHWLAQKVWQARQMPLR